MKKIVTKERVLSEVQSRYGITNLYYNKSLNQYIISQ